MPFSHDPSTDRKHERDHRGSDPNQPHQLSEEDKHFVSVAELENEDGEPIVAEVYSDKALETETPHSETLKIKVLTGVEALKSHKTAHERLDRAEAAQLDENEGKDRDYYDEWKDDIGKREKERDYAPKHPHPHGHVHSSHGK